MKNLILLLSALCFTLSSYTQNAIIIEEEFTANSDEVYTMAEKMPDFPGGNSALLKYLRDNIKYPPEALKLGIGGKVMVEFIVDASGKIKNPTIKKSLGALLDEEALRVVSQMPLWEPGSQSGKNVAVRYILPIVFRAD